MFLCCSCSTAVDQLRMIVTQTVFFLTKGLNIWQQQTWGNGNNIIFSCECSYRIYTVFILLLFFHCTALTHWYHLLKTFFAGVGFAQRQSSWHILYWTIQKTEKDTSMKNFFWKESFHHTEFKYAHLRIYAFIKEFKAVCTGFSQPYPFANSVERNFHFAYIVSSFHSLLVITK